MRLKHVRAEQSYNTTLATLQNYEASAKDTFKKMLTSILTTLFIFCVFLPLVPSVIVSTNYGKVEGLITSHPNVSSPQKTVTKFLGIPFAAPPIDDLRFKAPLPPKAWKPDVRKAKKHGNICWQFGKYTNIIENYIKMSYPNPVYSEDCLYLDVYTPNVSLSLPVLVYIHGGAYEIGTAVIIPSDILALHGVVVVVIQYRLGPFGFLTTGDSAAPGNFGMMDQVKALKWVKDNIENFGGNPNKVTIFGESAGGTSVSLHLMSPLSKDLFHQAIAESGVDFSPFAIQPLSFGIGNAKALAGKLGCDANDPNAMVTCIREKKDSDIKKAANSASYEESADYLTWAPVVDKNFLHDTPRNLRKRGDFKKVNLMISFNSQEGASSLAVMAKSAAFGLTETVDNGVSPSFLKTFLKKLARVRNSGEETADLIAHALEFMYTPWPDNSDRYALRSQLVDLIGDYIYFAPSHEVADIHSQVAPVYIYEFAHRRILYNTNPEWMGVVHADNIPYDFGLPLLPKTLHYFDAADRNVSRFIMGMYANFARSGDPSVSGVTWERFNSSHRAYLRVDANPKMAASFYPRRMAFWNDYHPKLTQVKFDIMEKVASGSSAVITVGLFVHIALAIVLVMS